MKRSKLISVIEGLVEENGLETGEVAAEFASDLADKLEEEFGLIDEDDEEDDEEEEE